MKTITITLKQKASLNLAAAGLGTFGEKFLEFGEKRTAQVTDNEALTVKRLAAQGLLDYEADAGESDKITAGKTRKGGK